jgi:SAM-dependent methyltransferase
MVSSQACPERLSSELRDMSVVSTTLAAIEPPGDRRKSMIESFGIKSGYQPNIRGADTSVDAGADYWSEDRIRNSFRYQYDVYRLADTTLKNRRSASFLDVGCGVGTKVAGMIVPHAPALCLGDHPSSRELVEQFVPGAHFVGQNLETVEVSLGRTFDVVVCADVLEHLHNPVPCTRFLRDHLAPGGVAFISTPERDYLRGSTCMESPHPSHVREWNRDEFRSYLTSQGLSVQKQIFYPQEKWPYLEFVFSRFFQRLFRTKQWSACQVAVCTTA